MNNALGASDVPLTVFGGAVTEMKAEDLPEGASPLNQDMDFAPGGTFTRGGRKNQYYYENLFLEVLAGFAQNGGGPNAAWSNPSRVTVGTPGSYAAVALNSPPFAAQGYWDEDGSTTKNGNVSSGFNISSSASLAGELAMCFSGISNIAPGAPHVTDAGWTSNTGSIIGLNGNFFGLQTKIFGAAGAQTTHVGFTGGPYAYSSIFAFFGTTGVAPSFVNATTIASGTLSTGNYSGSISSVQAGSTIFVFLACSTSLVNALITNMSATDDKGNEYFLIGIDGNNSNGSVVTAILMAPNVVGGTTNVTVHLTGGPIQGSILDLVEVRNLQALPGSPLSVSQTLETLNFPLSIPAAVKVLGLEVELTGKQTSLATDCILTVSLPNFPLAKSFTVQLPLTEGTVIVGGPLEDWGLTLTPDVLNDPSFEVDLVASALGGTVVTFDLSAVRLKPFLTPDPPTNFNWIKTYEQDNGDISTLLLDASGILWEENVVTLPGALNSIFTAIEPNTFAKSVTFLDTEWIALSDLVNGTDMPRQWDGRNLDRVSQVGPGAPPVFSSSGSTIDIVNITQPTAKSEITHPGQLSGILWSAGPGNTSPGNIVTVYYALQTDQVADPDLVPGIGVALAGVDSGGPNNNFNGHPLDGDYIITSIGSGVPPGAEFVRWYFTIQVAVSQFVNQADHEEGHGPDGTYQVTEATLTAASQVPNLEVGNQMTLAGTGGAPTAGYDGTWTVLETPNASQLQIVSVSRSGGVATYGFTLITGSTPAVGQQVTVVGTLADDQSFNVSNVAINTVSPGSFTLLQPGNDVLSTAEDGSGTISGTIFKFDPLVIVGTKTGGTIETVGVIGIGIRRGVVMFETRSEGITQPSPYYEFTVAGSASTLNASQIPIGPPDTIRRIVAFTGANGGNYFYIPQPVTVTDNGQKVTYTSTVIPDNTSTSATFSFPDAVLLAGIAIDVQGNNLFAQRELGSCKGFLSYSSRLFAWGEQNKVQNFLNLSFDGGYNPPAFLPLGWTVDPTNGAGGTLAVSPLFGNSYYIQNTSGSLQALYGMIEQGAYQNQLGTPIINSNVRYSVRLTARCPSQIGSGDLVVDLYSPQLAQVFGSFSVPLASMGTTMTIFSGELLTEAQEFGIVPKDLLLRVYAANLPNGGDVELDRVEPFPTDEPVFRTSFTASYVNNPQGFDGVTGNTGPNQNQQAINGGATMFDLLYALKERSIYSTSDNGVTEPAFWNWREVSQKVGTIGIHSYDYGEDWLATACRPGVYFFNGGTPIKVSQEFQTIWDAINWQYGYTIWLRNDVENKRLLIGIPIATGPGTTSFPYMPEMPANASPTTPNVVLAMNYRELNTGMAFAETGPIKSSYSGRLLSPEPARKTSFWNIRSPYADFIDRGNNETPLFFCTGYSDSKIFALDRDQLSDDGTAINSFYFTYGFTKADMQDAKGLGLHRMILTYLTTLAIGSGNLNIWVYPETPLTPVPFILDSIPLDPYTLGDLESAVDALANRYFIRFGTNAVGARFELSKVVASLRPDPWTPIRGSARGSP
jgi:hypothetical protein